MPCLEFLLASSGGKSPPLSTIEAVRSEVAYGKGIDFLSLVDLSISESFPIKNDPPESALGEMTDLEVSLLFGPCLSVERSYLRCMD